jgi:hypothetical protein
MLELLPIVTKMSCGANRGAPAASSITPQIRVFRCATKSSRKTYFATNPGASKYTEACAAATHAAAAQETRSMMIAAAICFAPAERREISIPQF